MKTFVIVATIRGLGRVAFESDVRVTVSAVSLSDAYKAVRKLPEFRHAYLRPA